MLFTPWLDAFRSRSSRRLARRAAKRLARRESTRQPHATAVEQLETKTLLTGPAFISVSPNVGDFLQDGDVREAVPQEFTFQFSPGFVLDTTRLDAIQVYGAGHDGSFTPAGTITDFGTGGQVVARIGTKSIDPGLNGTALTIMSANNAGNGPTITGNNYQNEVQQIALNGPYTGTFTLTFGVDTTNNISAAATAATIQNELEMLPSIGAGNVRVGGGPLQLEPITVEFTGALTLSDQPLLVMDSTNLVNPEIQNISISGTPTGGTYRLAFDDAGLGVMGVSNDINLNDTPTQIIAAIEGGIGGLAGQLAIAYSSPFDYSLAFSGGAVVDMDVASFTVDDNSLTGGANPSIAINTVIDGDAPGVVTPLADGGPAVRVLTLDTDPTTPTTLERLIEFAANDPVAQQLISVELVSGDPTVPIGGNGTEMRTLQAAGSAWAVSGFDTGTDLQVLFEADTAGLDGNDISLQVNLGDLGAAGPAQQINVVGNRIEVVLNENAGATARDLVDALNNHIEASALITASVPVGLDTTDITTIRDGSLISLANADYEVDPGFRDIGDLPNEVFYRFARTIQNDVHRIEVIGTGIDALIDSNNNAVNGTHRADGVDSFQDFTIELGAQVRGTVPQPVLREQLLTIADVNALSDGDTFTIDPGTLPVAAHNATASADYNSAATVEFTARQAGSGGNDVTIVVSKLDQGMAGLPTVNVIGKTIIVQLNEFATGESTADDLVTAIEMNPDATALVDVMVTGVGTTDITTTADPVTTSVTSGAMDLFTFEFNDTTNDVTPGTGVRPGNLQIDFDPTIDTPTVLAGRIATAIGMQPLVNPDVQANANNDTVAIVGGAYDVRVTLNVQDSAAASVVAGGIVHRRDRVNVFFNPDELDETLAQDPAFYRLFDINDTASTGDDTIRIPTEVIYDNVNHKATLTFAGDLPTATYRLQVGVVDEANNTTSTAIGLGSQFDTTGFTDNGFVGDDRDQGPADVDLYEVYLTMNTALSATVTPDAGLDSLILIFNDVGAEQDDSRADGGAGSVDTANFVAPADGFYYIGVSSAMNDAYNPLTGAGAVDGGSTGSYRITLTSNDTIIASDANSSFDTATDLGTLGDATQRFSAAIQPQGVAIPQFPGGPDEPGHRDIPAQTHGPGPGTAFSPAGAIELVEYNFASVYGSDSQGNTLFNQITEEQKDRTREIFEMYASQYGFEVRETASSGIQVVTGDPRVLGVPPTVGGVAGGNLSIMNAIVFNDPADDVYGGAWMGTALHELGHNLGLIHSYEIRSYQGNSNASEDDFPGHHDVVHGKRLHRPESIDIDVYEFDVVEDGTFKAEIIAERLATTSLLDSALRLYSEDAATGERTLIAQNDDYFSDDAYIEVELSAGKYFVGVSSTGNTDYDPSVPDSGFAGITDGNYDLKLSFDAAPASSLEDQAGSQFDGDLDSVQGGVFNFDFRVSDVADTIFVDKTVVTTLTGSIGSATTTIPVVDASVFPPAPFMIDIDNETMNVTTVNLAGNTLTVDPRGAGGVSHAGGAVVSLSTADGSLANPFGTISAALAAAGAGDTVRIVGNGGADNDILTPDDARPYVVGLDVSNNPLEDGSVFEVPGDVVVQFDAGAVVKLRSAVIDAGTSNVVTPRVGAAVQVLGTPHSDVFFTTYANDNLGGDSDGNGPAAMPGDWGGIVFREDSDFSDPAATGDDPAYFLNYVNHADMSFGGGRVTVNTIESVFTPIHIETTRPTVTFNTITNSSTAAISADPDSFDDSRGRIGPHIRGNEVTENTFNGLFTRIDTAFGEVLDRLSLPARFDDRDIVHIITENLEIVGSAGGPFEDTARLSGRLRVDPGVIVKLSASRIEGLKGSSHLIAEGTPVDPVRFTSLKDDRFGAGGTFDSGGDMGTTPGRGDWGGLVFNAVANASIDQALISFGGGETPIAGGFATFNVIEAHHYSNVRVANSTIEENANGTGSGGNRNNRLGNGSATIFVRQSQPVIVQNVIRNNDGPVININANAMMSVTNRDQGRSTGLREAVDGFANNRGPLVRRNRIENNGTGGMLIRGDVLTTESVWDDTDIVHVLQSEILVDDHHTYSGLRLQSSVDESLVVKLSGGAAGLTADGILLDIDDRIGGTVQVVGQPGFPVIMTSLADDTVGASLNPAGFPHFDTNNNGDSTGSPGQWRGLVFEKNSNDRNVRFILEQEAANNEGIDVNNSTASGQFLGELAPNGKSGDDNRVLGFDIQGFISADDSADEDVYSFKAPTQSEVWIDLDRTGSSLDAVVELIDQSGNMIAGSIRSDGSPGDGREILTGTAGVLARDDFNGGDYYTLNHKDPGFRVTLPGPGPAVPGDPQPVGTFFVRVRSNGATTSGEYQLQIRPQQRDEKSGSIVQFADIRFATIGIDVRGLPAHSPLLGESSEVGDNNDSVGLAQKLGNLLESDRNTISVAGELVANGSGYGVTEIDFYRFSSDYAENKLGGSIQTIGGVNDGGKTWAAVFDLDYSDGLTRGDTTMTVFDASGTPILIGRESSIRDDQPAPGEGNDLDDLLRGSVGKLDPFIGTVQLPTGTPGQETEYFVAIHGNTKLSDDLDQYFNAMASNPDVRLEPVNSVTRIIEDHIGVQGYDSNGTPVMPVNPAVADGDNPNADGALFDIADQMELAAHVRAFDLGDVPLFVSGTTSLRNVNALFGETVHAYNGLGNGNDIVQDIAMRSDGQLYAYQRLNNNASHAGKLATLDVLNTGNGSLSDVGNDNIPDYAGTNANFFNDEADANSVGALTWRRTGNSAWQLFYAIHEGADNSKLYRAKTDGNAARSGNAEGFKGDILPAGTSFARDTITVSNGIGGTGQIWIQAREPGAGGNGITVNINSTGNGGPFVSVGANTVTVTVDDDNSPADTVNDIVTAINANAAANNLISAGVISGGGTTLGNGADPPETASGTTAGGIGTPLNGLVTGLAHDLFTGGTLYGVTDAGEFMSITPNDNDDSDSQADIIATANIIRDFQADGILNAGEGFQGLTLGPQNLEGGRYSGAFFAVTDEGRLVAFDTAGNGVIAFDTTGDGMADADIIDAGLNGATGLAFSPLDFNLWHPTNRRGAEAGHGINEAYDLSRGAVEGETSFFFGLEPHPDVPGGGPTYLPYESAGQLGVLNEDTQRDLTNNSLIRTATNNPTYNLPAGAYGSLITDPFDLTSSTGMQDEDDRPVLYFNYWLETEGAGGAAMADAARVFVFVPDALSTDVNDLSQGTWELVATNNSALGEELPPFLSDNRFETTDPRQHIQELFDVSDWRQARVDLSDFVGTENLRFRFDFTTSGAIISPALTSNDAADLGTLGTVDTDGYGDVGGGARNSSNRFEGFYIDDIIVGWAERGEMITAARADQTANSDFFDVPVDPAEIPNIIERGPYQFEIRRGTEHAAAVSDSDPEIAVAQTFDTNDRLIKLPSTPNLLTEDFETIPPTLAITNPDGWNIVTNAIDNTMSLESITPADNATTTVTLTAAVNGGVISFDYDVDSEAGDRFRFFIDGGPIEVHSDSGLGGGKQSVAFSINPGVHTFEWIYAKDAGGSAGRDNVWIDNIVIPEFQITSNGLGDQNIERQQGAFHIEGNFIRDSLTTGISIQAGSREQAGAGGALRNDPRPGSPINFDLQNTKRFAPGVTVVNNVVAGFGTAGISFAGGAAGGGALDPVAPVPVGKLINNTIYGGQLNSGTGIEILQEAAPIVLNNIIANTQTGIIRSQANDAVVGRTLFHNNNTNGFTGNDAILDLASNPLFVDPATGNFYLDSGAEAIDRSLGSLPDLTEFVAVKEEVGIPNSDAFSPDMDLFGQRRVDDPSQLPSGVGGEVFNDLGGIERADFVGGLSKLVVPEDNGVDDLEPLGDVVHVDNPDFLNQFVVQFTDDGIGINDASVMLDGSQFIVNQTTRFGTTTLVEGTDYIFAYNANTNEAIMTSVTLFPVDARYTISVDNTAATGIKDFAGNALVANQGDGTLRFDVLVTSGANDPPENTVPGTQTLPENTAAAPTSITLSAADGNAISVDDADAFINTNEVQVTLSVTNGLISLPANYASLVTLNSASAVNATSITFTGTIPNVNAMLAGGVPFVDRLTFVPTQDFNGTAVLTVLTNDLGNFSADMPLIPMFDSDNVNIIVTPVNSEPINVIQDSMVSTDEDTTLTFNAANSNLIQISDAVDGDLGTMQLTLTVTNGTISLNPAEIADLDFAFAADSEGTPAGTGTGDTTMTFRGTVTDINEALDGLTFDPTPNVNGSATLTMTLNDLGNTGAGTPLTDMDTVDITITAINDAPVNRLGGVDLDAVKVIAFDMVGSTSMNLNTFVDDAGIPFTDAADVFQKLQRAVSPSIPAELLDDTIAASPADMLGIIDETNTDEFFGILDTDNPDTTGNPVTARWDFVVTAASDLRLSIDFAAMGDFEPGDSLTVRYQIDGGAVLTAFSSTVDVGGMQTYTLANGTTMVTLDDPLQIDGVTLSNLLQTLTTNLTGTGDTLSVFVEADVEGDSNGIALQNMVVSGRQPHTEQGTEDIDVVFSAANGNQLSIADTDIDEGAMPGILDVTLTVNHTDVTLPNDVNITLNPAEVGDLDFGMAGGDSDGSDGTLRFQGTLTDINEALSIVTITPPQDHFGPAGMTLTILTDDLGNTPTPAQTDTDVITIDLAEGNDPPTHMVPGLQVLNEETTITVTPAITVFDPDSAANPIQVTLSATKGVLSLNPGEIGDLDFAFVPDAEGTPMGDGTGDSTMVFRGPQNEINEALNGLTYTGSLNEVGSDTITITTNDLGHVGAPGVMITTDTVPVQIDPLNDAPTVSAPATVQAIEDTDFTFTQASNPIVVSDVDDPLEAGLGLFQVTLLVTPPGGETAGSLILSGNGGASVIVGSDNSPSMTIEGTLADINLALDGLIYRPASARELGTDVLSIDVDDRGNIGAGAAMTGSATVNIDINGENDAPVNNIPAGPVSTPEETPIVLTGATAVSVTDVDAATGLLSIMLTTSDPTATILLDSGSGVTNVTGDGTDSVTFDGQLAQVNDALDGLTFTPGLDVTGPVSLTIETNDNGNTGLVVNPKSDTDSLSINVTPVNDAPTVTGPVGLLVDEDDSVTISSANMNGITVDDVDIEAGKLKVTLTVSEGVLALSRVTGLTFASGSATPGSTMTFTGSRTAINAALDGMRYTPNPGYNGPDSLDFDLDDQGNTGAGGPLTADVSIPIIVEQVNDSPAIIVTDADVTVDESTPLIFSTTNSNGITIEDIDALEGTGIIQVSLTVGDGTLSLSTTNNIDFAFTPDSEGSPVGNGVADPTMTFRGTIIDVNVALSGLTYLPNPNFTDTDTLNIHVNDLGNTGKGGPLQDLGAVMIDVRAINDPPVNTVPGVQTIDEGDTLTFSPGNAPANTISVTDPDVGTDSLQVSLSVDHGALSLNLAGLDTVFSDGNGTGDADGTDGTLVFRGTEAAVNAALDGLTYDHDPNYSGSDTLTIVTSDLGSTGDGGVKTDSDTVDITINAVNDKPIAVNDTYYLLQGATLTTTDLTGADADANNDSVLVNDSDPDGDAISAVIDGNPAFHSGPFALQTTGTFTYVHNGTNNFTDSFTYRVTDNALSSDPATVNFVINAVPTITGDTFSIDEHSPFGSAVGSVTASDLNGGDMLSYSIIAGDPTGAFQIDGSGNITVLNSNALDFESNSTFNLTVQVQDDAVAQGTATASVTVNLNDLAEAVVVSPGQFTSNGLTLSRTGSKIQVTDTGTGAIIVPPHEIANVTSLVFDGRDNENDTLTIDFSGSDPIPGSGVTYDGGVGGFDSLAVVNGVVNNVAHNFSTASSGTIDIDGSIISYNGLEPITDNLDAQSRDFNFGSALDVVTIADTGTANDGMSRISSAGTSELVDFAAPVVLMSVSLGNGNDVLTGTGLDQNFAAGLSIDAGSGIDSVDLSGIGVNATVLGGSGNDNLIGGSGNDFMIGGSGNDFMNGGDGADRLFGASGSDELEGGPGDELHGQGTSFDINRVNVSGNVVVTTLGPTVTQVTSPAGSVLLVKSEFFEFVGGNGDDDIDITAFAGRAATVLGGDGNDTVRGSALPDVIDGGIGDDSVLGGGGNDLILLGDGNDYALGDDGSDTINGGQGNDHMLGAADADLFIPGDGVGDFDIVIGQGSNGDRMQAEVAGNVTIQANRLFTTTGEVFFKRLEGLSLTASDNADMIDGRQFGGQITVNAGAGNDTVFGTNQGDLIFGEGGDDLIEAGGGNNVVDGGDDNDSIRGGSGNDILIGNFGNDVLLGEVGDDVLIGGANNDLLLGGLGADFVKGNGSKDSLAGGGNGDPLDPLDVIRSDAIDVIDNAFSFDFDALLL